MSIHKKTGTHTVYIPVFNIIYFFQQSDILSFVSTTAPCVSRIPRTYALNNYQP